MSSNKTKEAILNNEPIEEKLHVIIVVSNPCLYKRRYELMKEFIDRMEKYEPDVILYIVELAYGNQKFAMTNPDNKNHLQLRTKHPLWHKENMINLGVKYLLPESWKAFAWIDSDIEFESTTWAKDTLKILNGTKDIVQLFSHCDFMDRNESITEIKIGGLYQTCKSKPLQKKRYLHPGFAWACTRSLYEKIGGLYDLGILGGGDVIIMWSIFGNGLSTLRKEISPDYKKSIVEFEKKMKNARFGYTPGVIRHHYHGSSINRHYVETWDVLIKYDYSPYIHVSKDSMGLLVPTEETPKKLLDEIYEYFFSRKEDD